MNRKIQCRTHLIRAKIKLSFFRIPHRKLAFPTSYHTRWGCRDRTRISTHIYGKYLFLYSIAWITRLIWSILRSLCLSSRIISFIFIVLPLDCLFSFPDAQTFENALCRFNLWQSLSSETSRWNMQAIGTPVLSHFHHEFSLDQLIIRETTKDSTRRSFPKCFNLNDRHVMMSPKLHI